MTGKDYCIEDQKADLYDLYFNNINKIIAMNRYPKVLTHKSTVDGAQFVDFHIFKSHHKVPVYEVFSTGALNQLIGHAKFDNAIYGNVYYRGVDSLYDNVLPTLMRSRSRGIPEDLSKVLKSVCIDEHFHKSLKLRDTIKPRFRQDYCLNKKIERYNKYCVEGLLQHYAGSTRFLDVVDNHWIALWMGLHSFNLQGDGKQYCDCTKRVFNINDIYELLKKHSTTIDYNQYVYILLISMPHANRYPEYGITESDDFVEVDLRKALPSFYLRPHAQHALVIRKIDKHNINQTADYYDMAQQVICVLRIRIDRVDEWLGNGSLLTKSNLFPSPSIDHGYHNLLERTDVFEHPFQIKKYF